MQEWSRGLIFDKNRHAGHEVARDQEIRERKIKIVSNNLVNAPRPVREILKAKLEHKVPGLILNDEAYSSPRQRAFCLGELALQPTDDALVIQILENNDLIDLIHQLSTQQVVYLVLQMSFAARRIHLG